MRRMTDQNPSSALTKRAITPRNLLIGAGIVALVTAGGVGAYALNQQPTNEPVVAQSEPTETATPTPEPEPNAAPTAYYVVSSVSGLTLGFDGTGSTDTDGEIVGYAWDFGDGASATGSTTSHTFGDYGSYSVTLTVTDDGGSSHAFPAIIDVPAPAAPGSGGGAGGCPAGSFVAQGGDGVELLCMWDYCRNLTLPDPSHPECDSAWRP